MVKTEREKILDVITEVPEWSKRQFGNQWGDDLCLGRIAPLLGMVEELGEALIQTRYLSDWHEDTPDVVLEAIKDGLADLLIFLFDYCGRAGIEPREIVDLFFTTDFSEQIETSKLTENEILKLLESISRLAKIELKRIQGIRGYGNKDKYEQDKRVAVAYIIINTLNAWKACSGPKPVTNTDVIEDLSRIWEKVSKRNWKINKTDGISK